MLRYQMIGIMIKHEMDGMQGGETLVFVGSNAPEPTADISLAFSMSALSSWPDNCTETPNMYSPVEQLHNEDSSINVNQIQ